MHIWPFPIAKVSGGVLAATRSCASIIAAFVLAFALAVSCAMAAAPCRAFAAQETFAFVTDTHIGVGQTNVSDLKRAFAYIKKQAKVAAVVNCGDVTNVGGEKEYRQYAKLWKQSGIKAKAVYAFGNHDNAAGGYQKWLKKAGYNGYTKTTGVNLFKKHLNGGKALNSVTEFESANIIAVGGYFKQKGGIYPASTIKWLDKQLKNTVRAGKMAIVVTHYAPWHHTDSGYQQQLSNQTQLYGVCQSYPNVIYACGHEHLFEQVPEHFVAHYTYGTYAKAKATKYARTGIDAAKCRNKVHLLCLNSLSRVEGVFKQAVAKRHAWAYLVKSDGNGKFEFVERDLTADKTVARTQFVQETGSVVVSCAGLDAGDIARVKVKFSDGGTYGGVASGSTLTFARAAKLKLSGIPRGVLVTASLKSAPAGYKSANASQVEVTKGTSKATVSLAKTSSFSKPLALTAQTL